MSEVKFSCPGCQQHIECDAGYAGMQINCPSCNAAMIVPGEAPAPVPVPPPPTAPTYQRQQSAPPPAGGGGCPQCGAPMARGATLCKNCGYNKATGEALSPQAAAARRGASPGGNPKWYQNHYLNAFLLLLVFAGLYTLARTGGHGLRLAYLIPASIVNLGIVVWVIVTAFRTSLLKGVLSMICCLYQIYFVYFESDSTALKVYFLVNIFIILTSRYGFHYG